MTNTMILYEQESRENAISLAGHFRNLKVPVQLQYKKPERSIEAYKEYAMRRDLNNLLYLDQEGISVTVINLDLKRMDVVPLSEYLK